MARLDEVEREAWDAWTRSKGDSRSVSIKGAGSQCACADPEGRPDPGCKICEDIGKAVFSGEVTERTEERDGNPKFLQAVQRCIAKRCEILGLDSPKTIRLEEVDRISDRFADVILAFVPEEHQKAALAMLSSAAPKETVH